MSADDPGTNASSSIHAQSLELEVAADGAGSTKTLRDTADMVMNASGKAAEKSVGWCWCISRSIPYYSIFLFVAHTIFMGLAVHGTTASLDAVSFILEDGIAELEFLQTGIYFDRGAYRQYFEFVQHGCYWIFIVSEIAMAIALAGACLTTGWFGDKYLHCNNRH